MEVFNMEQDQLNSNLMPKQQPSSSSSASSSSSSRSLSCGQLAGDVCQNCRRGDGTVNNNNGPARHQQGVLSVSSSTCVRDSQDCTCKTSSSSEVVTSLGGRDTPSASTSSSTSSTVLENRTIGLGVGGENTSRPSPSRTVMSLAANTPSAAPGPDSQPISSGFLDQQQSSGANTAANFESPLCPHLLNSPEGVISSLASGNLNRQTPSHYCQACGPPSLAGSSENILLSSNELLSSSLSSSSPPSSGPIPIPSRTNRRPRPHHHHVSSSPSPSSQGPAEDNPLSSSPSEHALFSSSYSSSGWRSRDLDRINGATSGYSSSEPGHMTFFHRQSPKYFKQPSSSQDYANNTMTSGSSDKPSVFDQWPRNRIASRRTPSSKQSSPSHFPLQSANTSSSKTSSRSEPSAFGSARKKRGFMLMSRSSGGLTLSGHSSSPYQYQRSEQADAQGDSAFDPEVRRLPYELLTQLHELEHQNEDLSADVIFVLEERGYNIHDVLGKGISSTVRRVTQKQSGKEYAVKIIDISGEKCETAAVEQTKKDTFREIRVLRMCGGHPNIIELHDVFETPTFIFLVFEICKQGELFDYLTSVVSLSEKKTRFFMRQLLKAVQFCHEQNIVHRDLKPENILLDDDLNIKVSDFGFATQVESSEELSELCGTPGYLAPEVLAHSMYENVPGYGKEVDMWACGVIMYTLLCGAPPFWHRKQMMMLRAIMNADYTFNSPEWDDISDAPKNLIQKLLIVNPKNRLTAREALQHPFFHNKIQDQKKFNAKRKFRAGVYCVIFYTRLSFYYKHPPPIPVKTVTTNPYSIKIMRKIIDSCAFGMYRHWVKRVDNQNRAALFEHTLREDWKQGLIANNGSWNSGELQ